MKLICGLGNPGREYERHRHNVGFMVVDALLSRARAELTQDKFQARVGQGSLGGERILFVEPQTYMNLSGRSVAEAARFYKIEVQDVLVVHDELDLPFGRLQLKAGGGAGGHNGLKSMVQCLGEDAFIRVRVGIGKPEGPNAKERVAGYVLSNFDDGERRQLEELVGKAADMAESWVRDGLSTAMNRHNRKA
ncbi:aminoacyl-tRNA hydrolase [Corallococcus sp. AB004]|uniref:aminoacyl-tRNA hydrolase n=1 Tax=Corallococcus TaxID=83461 RepID=UPI000EA061FC|nr:MULTISPECIES: aminoacyl-tRNA hydrolase [Corallococcus]RKI35900.1 aminoacyl-tRNA hydrolase [Corallococcus sp. AB004]NPC74927.1 aminoacyl-tRNA hydrolase [Corallococcus exiguus]NPD28906.1 aminoacyl-tRNA hydrolase [Corallococcus exiguus]NRD48652.1 aminoacyl-tRNA hydrolase [Corallococcus exiguus]RKH98139.1 aminoacyl-tRNA hydrolase [Corallococcus sp. AB038B]